MLPFGRIQSKQMSAKPDPPARKSWHGFSWYQMMKSFTAGLMLLLSTFHLCAERINQEGRILGVLPAVTNSILFNTNNADTVLAAMQIFPVTNPWNECVSNLPVLANSDAMIAMINTNVPSASSRKLKLFQEMNFVLVPDTQLLVSNQFIMYPGDSDFNGGMSPYGLYPTPTNQPIEEWPTGTTNTLLQWQTNNLTGDDRHSIIVQPGLGLIYETWMALRVDTNWQAANGAIFNLNTNSLRPDGYTSGDAAGFPMFPALVRFDECERGMVEHACRLVVVHTRQQHIYPATHDASKPVTTDTNVPAMGQRLRLKASYVINNSWTKEEQALLLGLKKYGAMVSDNSSSFFSISITPDDRWGSKLDHIINGSIGITNFEVVQTTAMNAGPRSAGAPLADAGPDQTVAPVALPIQLSGAVAFSNTPPAILWQSYSGPGTVAFGNATQTNTTANFSAPGIYTLLLSADDGVHAVAYDAVVITVTNGITVSIMRNGNNVNLSWIGGTAPYVVQQAGALPVTTWSDLVNLSGNSTNLPATNLAGFFRVKGQ
jgi:hypothetical protein